MRKVCHEFGRESNTAFLWSPSTCACVLAMKDVFVIVSLYLNLIPYNEPKITSVILVADVLEHSADDILLRLLPEQQVLDIRQWSVTVCLCLFLAQYLSQPFLLPTRTTA